MRFTKIILDVAFYIILSIYSVRLISIYSVYYDACMVFFFVFLLPAYNFKSSIFFTGHSIFKCSAFSEGDFESNQCIIILVNFFCGAFLCSFPDNREKNKLGKNGKIDGFSLFTIIFFLL